MAHAPTTSGTDLTHFTAVIEAFEDPAALIGTDGRIVGFNRAWKAHGFEEAELADGDPIPAAIAMNGRIRQRASIGRRGSVDGWRWYRSRVRALDGIEGVGAILTHRDITDERRLQMRMSRSPVAHLELDSSGSLMAVNERWEELRGRPVGAELGTRWLRDTPRAERDQLVACLQEGQPFEFELSTAGSDDRRLTLTMDFEPLFDGDELIGWNASASDLTELRALESAAENALVDTVTRLANRAIFETTLARRLAKREPEQISILFVDLDGFKAVNDRHGHLAGDEALRAIASRLSGVLRPEDLIARFGGDEFAVMLASIGTESAAVVASRLVDAAREPIPIGTDEVQVGVSVGVATSTPHDDVDAMIARADQAMYRAKHAGGGQVAVADER